MFHFLKYRLVQALQTGAPALRLALRALGTRYDFSRNVLHAPWLCLPYPQGGSVDLVHIDDIVKAMVTIDALDGTSSTTLHLTQRTRLGFVWLLKSLLCDLGLQGVKHFALPAPLFRLIAGRFYDLIMPHHAYVRSILSYLPYITRSHRFSNENGEAHPSVLHHPIAPGKLSEINRYAMENVFPKIARKLYPNRLEAEPFKDRAQSRRIRNIEHQGTMNLLSR